MLSEEYQDHLRGYASRSKGSTFVFGKESLMLASLFIHHFEETFSHINMRNLDATIEWIRYTVNDMDNAFSEIDYNDPMLFFEIAGVLGKVIAKNKE